MVYFSDITFTQRCKDSSGKFAQAGNIWKYDPRSKQATIFRSPSGMSNSMKFDAQGNLIIAEGADFGGRHLTKTDMKTGKSYILTGLYNGQPYNALNDLTIDADGRIYFTDPRYLGWEPMNQPVQAVYRLDPDGKVTASSRMQASRMGSRYRLTRRPSMCWRMTMVVTISWKRVRRRKRG